MSEADELVELIVPARERSCVAVALLHTAEMLGLPAEVVRSTSTGYRVPQALADETDEQLAEKAGEGAQQVYAAHRPGGRVTYARDGEQPVDDHAVEPELPEPVKTRGKRGAR